ncbi:cobalt-precorrin-6A reductase [Ornithinimicrobium tianjinense]|uniref:Precorrin-6A reductase n=1 Tax=Ornithinimicrobium tianjinense TaxID=1195761 RepID=A0A917F6U1_9MICO|nr:cobalt-precorrin-6A reductase [Ornithinimicrobium tianjinense]GGF51969.1 precorrin-6A reductase [Ornithinimicrobium tianjinense]
MTSPFLPNVLVLGGTAEARDLAARLHAQGYAVTSSLAGRVSQPRLPVGAVRVGGFGGEAGLAAYLSETATTHLVDATHPFAATMSQHAARAAERTGVPLVRFARPGWAEHPDAGRWTWVESHEEAAALAAGGSRPFLTTGRQTLSGYAARAGLAGLPVLVRVVEEVDEELPEGWTVVRDRGPYTVEGEMRLMREHGTDLVVTKDSGGDYTSAKLDAAREVGARVVVVRRPATVPGVTAVEDLDDVVGWVTGRA